MPELPEVEGYRIYIDNTALNKKITAFECRENRLLKKSIADFEAHLINQEFTATERIGKYLFIKTSGEKVLVMHFGMTGKPTYYKAKEDRPKYGHIVLTFENRFHFAFESKRKFGWWDLIDSIPEYKAAHKLSVDARDLSLKDFKTSLNSRKTAIKAALMDQSVAAGIGNWMADEILYQSKIHPESKVQNLSENNIETIFKAMKKVIEVALENDAHYDDFPEDFLIHFRKEGGICFHTGAEIQKIKVGGRSTYCSPKWQEMIK
ncbi:MAG: DNA-formamidopyrimidine glycosylase family protein [Gelidibacter sp.]